MKKAINPFIIDGNIHAVASKSCLQRAIAISCLSDGISIIENFYPSSDAISAKNVIEKLGAKTTLSEEKLFVDSDFKAIDNTFINVGESGLGLRIFAFLSAITNKNIILDGEKTLRNRPIEPLLKALQSAGVSVKSSNNRLPIEVCGTISNRKIYLDGAFSSQIISGLLIVAPMLMHDTEVFVSNLASKNYVALTIEIMKHFGVNVSQNNLSEFYIKGNQKYKPTKYVAEGDWSAASNFLVAAAVSGKIAVSGLNIESLQPDIAICNILSEFGAKTFWKDSIFHVEKNKLNPIDADLSDCPDLFPPAIVLAAAANGVSFLKGSKRLIHKESNRLMALISNFEKIGLKIETNDNAMKIFGNGYLQGGNVQSYDDHRIVMSAAIAATISKQDIILNNFNSIEKSYPTFLNDLYKIAKTDLFF